MTESLLKSSPRKHTRLFLVGVICLVLAGAFRLYHRPMPAELVDDADTAPGLLTEQLKRVQPDEQMPVIVKYADDARPGWRAAAVDALASQKGDVAATTIEHAFGDNASIVRQTAVENLSKVDARRGLRLLLVALKDEDQWIRQAAVQQIISLTRKPVTNKEAVPGLIVALSDADPSVAANAMAGLRKIVGKPWYAGIKAPVAEQTAMRAKWQAWWRVVGAGWMQSSVNQNVVAVRPTRTDPSPDFNAQDIEGKSYRLATQKGRITLLNFWGTWCPPCQMEVPDLQKLNALYRGRGVDVIGVAVAETNGATGLRNFAAKHHLTYPQMLATARIQKDFGNIEEVPVSFLIDRKGQIRYRWDGERDFRTFQAAVERLLVEPG